MSNLVMTIQTMSSVEIAELTGKRHDNVMSDIKKMLAELNLRSPDFSGEQTFANNRKRSVFNLPKRECLILVSGYSVELRAKIIDRWQELENQQPKLPNFTDPAEAAMAWANQYRETQALAQQLQTVKPVVLAYQRLTDSTGMQCITDVAKEMQVNPTKLSEFMAELKWIYRRTPKGKWVAQQYQIDCGRLAHKTYEYFDSENNPQTSYSVLVTTKGKTELAKLWEQRQQSLSLVNVS